MPRIVRQTNYWHALVVFHCCVAMRRGAMSARCFGPAPAYDVATNVEQIQSPDMQPQPCHTAAPSYKVGCFVGSLSSNWMTRLLAKALVRLALPELQLVEIPIRIWAAKLANTG
jgi:hypothetical protein